MHDRIVHASDSSPRNLIDGLRCAEWNIRTIQLYITVKNMCQPGFALHGSCHHRLSCGRDGLREPAALRVSSCERPQKLGITATRKLHCLLSELYRFDAITNGRIGSS